MSENLEKSTTYRPHFPAAKTSREIELEKILKELVDLKSHKDFLTEEKRKSQQLGISFYSDIKAAEDSYHLRKAKAWADARRILEN